ncbi:hypothetical protein K474DRAFT_1657264 [Panus rudis PR-1116 ss-1]|nr:hypothetical protein K474DRAFT_1657264 [Panus rudis PR-1116 ss-1]
MKAHVFALSFVAAFVGAAFGAPTTDIGIGCRRSLDTVDVHFTGEGGYTGPEKRDTDTVDIHFTGEGGYTGPEKRGTDTVDIHFTGEGGYSGPNKVRRAPAPSITEGC